jgi:DNA-binding CsgD family transcriptional regulator
MPDRSIEDLVEEIAALPNRDRLLVAVRTFMSIFGYMALAIASMPAEAEPARFYLASFPEDWSDFSAHWSLAFDDRRVRAAMHGLMPFTSDDLGPPPEAMRRALATASGPPRQALIIPVYKPGWGVGSVSFIADESPLLPVNRALVQSFSGYAFERAVALGQEPAPTDGSQLLQVLTAREHQCLEFVANGLSDAQIAEKLSISWSTAHYHVEHARRKLGAHNRAHAVALAMRSRLV